MKAICKSRRVWFQYEWTATKFLQQQETHPASDKDTHSAAIRLEEGLEAKNMGWFSNKVFTPRNVAFSDNVLGRERDSENSDSDSVSQKWWTNLGTRTCSPRLGRRKERLGRMIPVKSHQKLWDSAWRVALLFPSFHRMPGWTGNISDNSSRSPWMISHASLRHGQRLSGRINLSNLKWASWYLVAYPQTPHHYASCGSRS